MNILFSNIETYSFISSRTWVRDKFAPALCGYHGNNGKGSYRGYRFIGEGKKDIKRKEVKTKTDSDGAAITTALTNATDVQFKRGSKLLSTEKKSVCNSI